MKSWPAWWNCELELSSHLMKRMEDRRSNEVELRAMLHHAASYRPDIVEGRWIIASRHKRRPWEVIVEPDVHAQLLVVVTAYPVVN